MKWITEDDAVKELAVQLLPMVDTGAVIRLENDGFSVKRSDIVEIWDEADGPGRDARMELCEVDTPDLHPDELLSALALLLGMRVTPS